MEIVRTENENNQLLNECVEAEEMGTTKLYKESSQKTPRSSA